MDHFGIFAKYWSPGKVKTRLGASIGEKQSARFYKAMLDFLVDNLQTVGNRRTIIFTPDDAEAEFETLNASVNNRWALAAQASGGLGNRMTQFFETAFADTRADQQTRTDQQTPTDNQTNKVVLIGSDCPQITPAGCQAAFDRLSDNDVVLGPTLDGGYYLIGMHQKFHDVFSGITYSTESVFDQTIDLMKRNGIKYDLLPPLQDIDELPQLIDLHRSLDNAEAASLPGHAELLAAIKSVMPTEPRS